MTDLRSLMGYSTIRIKTQVFQEGIPAELIPPPVPGSVGDARVTGQPALYWAGPDGVRRPLLVQLSFQRCTACRALVLDEDANAHTAWHAEVAQQG